MRLAPQKTIVIMRMVPQKQKLHHDTYGPATCKTSYVIAAYGSATLYTLRMVPQHEANA